MRYRGSRLAGLLLVGLGISMLIGAVLFGPWTTGSWDALFAGRMPERIIAAIAGTALCIVGWILCGSDQLT